MYINLYMYIYIHTYVYIYMCIQYRHIYIDQTSFGPMPGRHCSGRRPRARCQTSEAGFGAASFLGRFLEAIYIVQVRDMYIYI